MNDSQTALNVSPSGQDQAMMVPDEPGVAVTFRQMVSIMQGMADMLRTTNDRMGALERKVTMLEKVTPAQATAINAAIRKRADELCGAYRATNQPGVSNAIRRDIKLAHGVRSMRELPRVVYQTVVTQIYMWDDYKAMKALKAREK